MAIVTLDVPEELLGDLYIAVGQVLRREAEEDAAEERRQAGSGTRQGTTRAEPRPDMVQVTFEIPDHLLGSFYVVVGATLNKARPDVADEHAPPVDWGTAPGDLEFESAREVWRKFSPPAQAVFSLLIDNPGVAVTGEDIASKLDIPNGKRGVAGIVAWPARHCADAGYVPLFRCEDADGGYWMDPDTADLFARVRDAARPRPRPAS
jgi:hypothetical protein